MREPVIAEMWADFHCRKSFFPIFNKQTKKQLKAFTCAGPKCPAFLVRTNHTLSVVRNAVREFFFRSQSLIPAQNSL